MLPMVARWRHRPLSFVSSLPVETGSPPAFSWCYPKTSQHVLVFYGIIGTEVFHQSQESGKRSGMERKLIGRYIVADPKICHGKPTFRGTRVFVADVLADVAKGLDWDIISRRWHGLPKEAIGEAVVLAPIAP